MVAVSSWQRETAARRTSLLTRSHRPSMIQVVTREEPPTDSSGVVIPLSGISSVTPPTTTNTWNAQRNANPVVISLTKVSRARSEERRVGKERRYRGAQEEGTGM